MTPIIALVPFELLLSYRIVYLPERSTGAPPWLITVIRLAWLSYVPAALTMLFLNYRRSDDLTERRRIRVLALGLAVVAFVTVPFMLAGAAFAPRRLPGFLFVAWPVAAVSALALPASFAYAILRHRLFDIRVMIRQGLQYAVARKALLLLTPAFGAMLAVDLLLRGEQSLIQILRERGLIYSALAALGAWLHVRRQRWLRALDRRFFREQYNAQQVLGAAVREVRAARTGEELAPRIIAQIELALHPDTAGIFRLYGREPAYRLLAGPAMPASPLPDGARLCRILQVIGKPLALGDPRSSFRNNLPERETEFLREANVEWLFPVSSSSETCTAFLALGPKRSGQPYSRDDVELVQSIADSLGLLFQRSEPAAPQESCLECAACGRCYDPGTVQCEIDGSTLTRGSVPRLIQDRFRLERRIGQGGMGTVYEASDAELGRRVAIKILGDQPLGDDSAVSRFRREARVLASFQHPNVVTIFDAGSISSGRGFIVMELLRGVTLRHELAAKGPLPLSRISKILRGVCSAVDAAHRRAIVHRDLKPENVFLAEQQGGVVPKVLDFGIAALINPDAKTLTLTGVTRAGELVGTPGYIAPERFHSQRGGEACDIWSIGVISYEMLTGRHPFSGGGRHPTPISEYIPNAPVEWQNFFIRALADRPEERPHSPQMLFVEFLSAFRITADAAVPN